MVDGTLYPEAMNRLGLRNEWTVMVRRLMSWKERGPGVEGDRPNSVFLRSLAEA